MLPKFSVKKPYTVVVGVIIALILGFVSFMSMKTDLLPSIDLPFVMINTVYPGASPEKVETSITKPLEQALATTPGLKNISSVSSENSSRIMLEFEQGINMDSAIIDLNSKIDMVEGSFDESVRNPMIMKLNPDMMPIMVISADVEGLDIKETTNYIKNEILPKFERIEGVASVTAEGLVENRLNITLDKDKINSINDKMLSKVGSEFKEQEQKLSDAKGEISQSKNTLEKNLNTQINEINKGLNQVKEGKAKLEDVVSNINMNKSEIEVKVDDLKVELTQVKLQINNLKASLEKLPESAIGEIATINAQIQALEKAQSELENGISGLKKSIEAIDGLEGLKAQEKELTQAKATLERELSKASSELKSGEEELSNAQDQLKDAKESALKGASLIDKITPDMIGNILKAENFSMPAGYIKENESEYSIKVGDKFSTVEELENLLLFDTGEKGIGEIRLKDVAKVSIADNSGDIYTNINGNSGVMLVFQKASSYSTSEVTESINNVISSISNQDKNINITTLMDQGVYIDVIVKSVLDNLIYGGVLAIIVLLFFLRSFKTTAVVAFSIPISVLFALILMYFSGITLNIISLSGLALGVGMLVDNSIVVIENIYRLRNEGMDIKRAAVYGAKQVSGAIFASTLTTVCVFLPIVFTKGMTKDLFVDMGLTIAYSLFASLIVALTLVPAMASNLNLKITQKEDGLFYKFVNLYEIVLRKALDYKLVVILLSLVLLIFTGYKAVNMGTVFMPEVDSTQMTATLVVDEEATRQEKIENSNDFVEEISKIKDVQTVGAIEGSGMAMGPGSSSDISFYIILKEEKELSNKELADLINKKLKDKDYKVEISTSNMDMGALGGKGVQIQVKGPELDKLQKISDDIAKKISKVKGLQEISNGLEDSETEVRVVVDKEKAMKYGLTVAQVYQEISKAVEIERQVTDATLDNNDYPVIVENYSSVSKGNLKDYTIKGKKDNEEVEVKIGDIATIEEASSLLSINRDNQSKYITVSGTVDAKYNVGLVSRDVAKALKDYKVPAGYSIELKGENQTINNSMRDLMLMGMLAIIFVYLIMVAQFQSLLSPFIVMFTIPLAFTGGLLALLITGSDISVVSMLGFLVLSGVIVNNGIVFVDYINQLRLEGKEKREAIIETGRTRIRPILMTAMTTILAMLTMALGVGTGSEMTQGLAIVTIGGLIYGTVLTLVVIPVLYDLFHNRELKPIIIDED